MSRIAESPEQAERILERLQSRERAAARRVALYTIVPVIGAAALIVYSSIHVARAMARAEDAREAAVAAEDAATLANAERIEAARERDAAIEALSETEAELQSMWRRLEDTRRELEATTKELGAARATLSDMEEKRDAAADMNRFVHEIDIGDPKSAHISNPGPAAELLTTMLDLRMRGASFKWTGASPEEGFNSPTFAAYALLATREGERAARQADIGAEVSRLYKELEEVERPEPGDFVLYPGGYVMLYVRDGEGRPFVIGMTPFGVLPLEPDFAEPVGYRRWMDR